MRHGNRFLRVAGVVLVTTLTAGPAAAQWGAPWGPPGVGPYGPPVVGWEDWEVYQGPLGPSLADVRRIYRREELRGWGFPPAAGPFGPSPTDIRRFHRREVLRSWRPPY
jgi:hypothetical protein